MIHSCIFAKGSTYFNVEGSGCLHFGLAFSQLQISWERSTARNCQGVNGIVKVGIFPTQTSNTRLLSHIQYFFHL